MKNFRQLIALVLCMAAVFSLTAVEASAVSSIDSDTDTVDLKNAAVGDYVTFGSYEQDNNKKNGTEDIEWLVLDKTKSGLLLISRYALDARKYNSSYNEVSWETCSLRTWLNDTFYYGAFSSSERSQIATANVTADDNAKYSTSPGSDTKDKVFVLSTEEAELYFKSDSARKCKPTAYAAAQGAFKSTKSGIKGNTVWWLRTPGEVKSNAASANTDGTIYYSGDPVNRSENSVRPAIWVYKESSGSSGTSSSYAKPIQVVPVTSSITFQKGERAYRKNFKSTQTGYNVFDYEVYNCTGCYFQYKASSTSGSSCTGKRNVYVRSQYGEDCKDDSAWIYVGSFEYKTEGKYVTVDLTWPAEDVYAMAVIRDNLSNSCSYTASWGSEVTLYYCS